MPEFLTTKGVTSKIDDLISNSKKVLYLISPYISLLPETTLMQIRGAIKRGVKVSLIYRYKMNLHANEITKLKSLKGLALWHNPNLHAKAYFNENEAVVTSFNLSGSSELHNIEFGIHFAKLESKTMFDKLKRVTSDIIGGSSRVSIDEKSLIVDMPIPEQSKGFCIRCKTEIESNTQKPLCYKCYVDWNKYKNYLYVEKFCHQCGSSEPTNMQNPVCEDCQL